MINKRKELALRSEFVGLICIMALKKKTNKQTNEDPGLKGVYWRGKILRNSWPQD